MIVPIFPSDFERHAGLKKAARVLLKTWPGVKPILHSQALDLLVKGLGYESYHHAKQLASSWTAARPQLSINTIDWNLSDVLSDELRTSENLRVSINLGNLLAYVQTIPLHHLKIFKRYPELMVGRNSFPLLPYDSKSAFGRYQHSPVIPLYGNWHIDDEDESDEPLPS